MRGDSVHRLSALTPADTELRAVESFRVQGGSTAKWCGRTVQNALMNVRFEGNNGHDANVTRCLLLTQSGHLAPNHVRLPSTGGSRARLSLSHIAPRAGHAATLKRAPCSGPSSDNRHARSHSRSNNHKAGSHRCNSHTATHNRQVAEAAGLHRPPEVRAHCPRWLQYRTPPDRHPQRLHFPLGLELAEPTRPSLLHRQWRQESSCTLHESLKLADPQERLFSSRYQKVTRRAERLEPANDPKRTSSELTQGTFVLKIV